MFLTEKSLFGPIYVLFSASSISDRQQSLQLFTAISVIITKPHIINRSSVHRHTPCFEHGTIKHKKIAASTQHSNSKHSDLVAFWGHLKKLFFTTNVKKNQPPSNHFHCSHECPVCGWVTAAWCCVRSCFLQTVTSAYGIKPLNLLGSRFCKNPVRKSKAEAQEQNKWKGKQTGVWAREATKNDFWLLRN